MDKTRIVGMVLLGLMVIIAGVVGFESGQDDGPDNMPYFWVGSGRSGTLQKISPTEAVIKSGNDTLTFEINNMTKFTSRGSFSPLVPGIEVQVRYGAIEQRMVARQIKVLQAPTTTTTPGAIESPAAGATESPEPVESPDPAESPAVSASPQ